MKILAIVAAGGKAIKYFVFGPEYNFPGNCYSERLVGDPAMLAAMACCSAESSGSGAAAVSIDACSTFRSSSSSAFCRKSARFSCSFELTRLSARTFCKSASGAGVDAAAAPGFGVGTCDCDHALRLLYVAAASACCCDVPSTRYAVVVSWTHELIQAKTTYLSRQDGTTYVKYKCTGTPKWQHVPNCIMPEQRRQ